jgi:methyl-accepting chemotaxis protein
VENARKSIETGFERIPGELRMKNLSRIRVLGLIFIILAAGGILFSISGIAGTWIMAPRVNRCLSGLLDSFVDTLTTTDNALSVLDSVLQDSLESLELIVSSMDKLGSTVDDLSTSLEASGDLIGDDLRLTILDTQTALSSAASSAVFIDNTLNFIARLPIIGANYQPDVPLHTSLEQVAGSLDDVPKSLETIDQNLNDTAAGLNSLQLDLIVLSENIASMEEDLQDAQTVVENYQDIITAMEQKADPLSRNFSTYMIIAALFLSGFFFWLGTSLVNVLIQSIIFRRGEQQVVNLTDIQRD